MLRANLTVTVRSAPVRRVFKGKNGDFAVWTVDLLDSDYNKCEGRIADDQIGDLSAVFAEGAIVDVVADVSAFGGRLQVAVQQATAHVAAVRRAS